jgi:two-component system chemotaxis response regulator CheY
LKKILVADDAEFSRVKISKILSDNLFEVVNASSASQAVTLYKSEHPDLVLLDLSISNMQGLDSLRKIKNYDPQAKVVIMSVLGEENVVLEAIQSGARNYIRKPIDPNYVTFTIEKQLAPQ